MKPTLSSIVAPTRSVFTATGTETLDPISPRPSPPKTAPKAPSPSFRLRISFSLGISQSSKGNIAPVELASRRPSSRKRFLVSRYFEEYLAKKKSAWAGINTGCELRFQLFYWYANSTKIKVKFLSLFLTFFFPSSFSYADNVFCGWFDFEEQRPRRLIDEGTKNAWLIGAV